MKLDQDNRAWSVETVTKKVETNPTYLGRNIIRNFKDKVVFKRVELPTVHKTPEQLLCAFFKQNPVMHPIGSILQKNFFPENGWYAFAFHWGFAIFIEQDREANQHFLTLKYQSHFNNQWFTIAVCRDTLDTPLFFTKHIIEKKLHTLLLQRNFRIAATAEASIPTR